VVFRTNAKHHLHHIHLTIFLFLKKPSYYISIEQLKSMMVWSCAILEGSCKRSEMDDTHKFGRARIQQSGWKELKDLILGI
jgi:hypothetical protein